MNKHPVRVVVLGSGSMSSFRFLHAHDPNYDVLYQIVGAFSDVSGKSGIAFAKEAGIPTAELSFDDWRKEHGIRRSDLHGRELFFEEVLRLIGPWNPEAIMLSGLMLILTNPLYSAFVGRILNVHPALLSLVTSDGTRKYRGTDVVSRAMKDGAPTGSTVHIVTEEPDMGPIVAESAPLPYQEGDDPNSHQDRMKTMCDGPAFQAAFEKLIKSGWPEVPWDTN